MLKLIGDGRWVVERLLLFVAIAGLTLILVGLFSIIRQLGNRVVGKA